MKQSKRHITQSELKKTTGSAKGMYDINPTMNVQVRVVVKFDACLWSVAPHFQALYARSSIHLVTLLMC